MLYCTSKWSHAAPHRGVSDISFGPRKPRVVQFGTWDPRRRYPYIHFWARSSFDHLTLDTSHDYSSLEVQALYEASLTNAEVSSFYGKRRAAMQLNIGSSSNNRTSSTSPQRADLIDADPFICQCKDPLRKRRGEPQPVAFGGDIWHTVRFPGIPAGYDPQAVGAFHLMSVLVSFCASGR